MTSFNVLFCIIVLISILSVYSLCRGYDLKYSYICVKSQDSIKSPLDQFEATNQLSYPSFDSKEESSYSSKQYLVKSPLEQFEIRNLLSLDAPILVNLRLSLTNIRLYLTISAFIALLLNFLATNYNKVICNR